MKRPHIIMHMHMSLDGKIVGDYLPTDVGMASQREYWELFLGSQRTFREHKGWLSGRTTTEDAFTHHATPELDEAAAPVPDGDYLADTDAPMHYFAVDSSGVLGWQRNFIDYFETKAHVVEVLSGKASNAYKHFLRSKDISYLIAGEDQLDLELAVSKISDLFGVKELILAGGGGLNWSLIHAGLCDELSIVLTPAADGTHGAQTLFEANERYNAPIPTGFTLREHTMLNDGSLWLRYGVDGPLVD